MSYIVYPETEQIFSKEFYRVRAGINGKYKWEGRYVFYVKVKNLKEFYIEDTVIGDIVNMEVWRSREIKRNHK